ncbi:MAG: enoyl-CoA hydratase/isomerase family protein [Acidovorax sp.]|nr:enoyl-CoA hydratase/isomerase family protein [Acidovorax sp.]
MREDPVAKMARGPVLVLEMQDPASRNALSRGMLEGLCEAIGHAGAGVLGIVITGGAECFSAGGDFRELQGTREDLRYDDAVSQVVAAILASDRIIVAAIEGPCMGAAADIALACDYRIAGAGAFLQIPAVRLGLLYNPEAIDRLRRKYPSDTVRRLLLAGERFDDQAACQAGLFSRVVGRGASAETAVQGLAALRPQHADAVQATKRLLSDLDTGQAGTADWQERRTELLDSEPRREAVRQMHARFVHKTEPPR